MPSRSDTALRTTWTYNTDGSLLSVTDPMAIETRTLYDDAGRKTAAINNYVNGTPSGPTGDDDVYTRYTYSNGHQTEMWSDVDGDNVQDSTEPLTQWVYGVAKGTNPGTPRSARGACC